MFSFRILWKISFLILYNIYFPADFFWNNLVWNLGIMAQIPKRLQTVRMVFLIGTSNNSTVIDQLEREMEEYGSANFLFITRKNQLKMCSRAFLENLSEVNFPVLCNVVLVLESVAKVLTLTFYYIAFSVLWLCFYLFVYSKYSLWQFQNGKMGLHRPKIDQNARNNVKIQILQN